LVLRQSIMKRLEITPLLPLQDINGSNDLCLTTVRVLLDTLSSTFTR